MNDTFCGTELLHAMREYAEYHWPLAPEIFESILEYAEIEIETRNVDLDWEGSTSKQHRVLIRVPTRFLPTIDEAEELKRLVHVTFRSLYVMDDQDSIVTTVLMRVGADTAKYDREQVLIQQVQTARRGEARALAELDQMHSSLVMEAVERQHWRYRYDESQQLLHEEYKKSATLTGHVRVLEEERYHMELKQEYLNSVDDGDPVLKFGCRESIG